MELSKKNTASGNETLFEGFANIQYDYLGSHRKEETTSSFPLKLFEENEDMHLLLLKNIKESKCERSEEFSCA